MFRFDSCCDDEILIRAKFEWNIYRSEIPVGYDINRCRAFGIVKISGFYYSSVGMEGVEKTQLLKSLRMMTSETIEK